MVLLYSPHITPRITYITRYIFGEILKVSSEVTANIEEFESYQGPKINYSLQDVGAIKIAADSFMLHQGVGPIEVSVVWDKEIPLLFYKNDVADLPFDIFSAAFYMISRYEEYVTKVRDAHGRFQAVSSVAFKNGFLEMPVVDIWAGMIKSLIEDRYPGYKFPQKQFQFIPSIDIDVAYAYKGRDFLRTVAAAAKNIFNIPDQVLRWETLVLNKSDPFDTYHLFKQWHGNYNLRPIYFFHVGAYGGYDGCLSPGHPIMQNLIKKISAESDIGIHPSYKSDSQLPIIKSEMEILKSIVGRPIYQSRQHFLKFDISRTYPILAACGIREEYSMGYAEVPGFRAGTCTPFNFYDLNKEEEIALKIYPFTFMDGNWMDYLSSSPSDAIESIRKFVDAVKNVNGTLITIWHNQSLSKIKSKKDWLNVYPSMLDIVLVS